MTFPSLLVVKHLAKFQMTHFHHIFHLNKPHDLPFCKDFWLPKPARNPPEVSWNGGTPKSSILDWGSPTTNSPFCGTPHLWKPSTRRRAFFIAMDAGHEPQGVGGRGFPKKNLPVSSHENFWWFSQFNISQMFHGAGTFTYIYPKNHPVM